MLLAFWAHRTTVIPVEVVQVGVVTVGLLAGVGCATCIIFPGRTLKKNIRTSDHFYTFNLILTLSES